jgi:hypothetical protein
MACSYSPVDTVASGTEGYSAIELMVTGYPSSLRKICEGLTYQMPKKRLKRGRLADVIIPL